MKPRTELALGLGLLLVLGGLAGALGRSRDRTPDEDPRRSSYLSGPRGAQGFADALALVGITVQRHRQRTLALLAREPDSVPTLVAFLDPTYELDPAEAQELSELNDSGDLLLAGPGASQAMRCFGFAVESRSRDSVAAAPPGAGFGERAPMVQAVLATTTDTVVADTTSLEDQWVAECAVPPVAQVETLLVTESGRLVAARLHRADTQTRVVLVADGELFSNRLLRDTDAGTFALGLAAGRYDQVVIDEAHHGYGADGSLWAALLAWGARSPWGWAAWQLIVVGLLALLAGAVRFGPAVSVLDRRRRSPLEHVRALATALQAARGHDVAVGSIVQGLRRRLSPPGQRARGDWRSWIITLADHADHVRTARGRDAARTLRALTTPNQPALSVLRAANAAEDVWEELRP